MNFFISRKRDGKYSVCYEKGDICREVGEMYSLDGEYFTMEINDEAFITAYIKAAMEDETYFP